jgi:hypothetical protein
VDALVTTEKDAVNLCDAADVLLAPLSLFWLRISIAMERESEFLDEIERRIQQGAKSPASPLSDPKQSRPTDSRQP